jgi:hypothetical protein
MSRMHRWYARPENVPWEAEDLHEYVYCLICNCYFSTRHREWKLWVCNHAHLPMAGTEGSYLTPEDPEYSRQMWLKVSGHFRSSDEMLDGFTCDLTDLELLSLQSKEAV